MGILNVTPDSFSDGGDYSDQSLAIQRGIEMFELGVDIVDIGGESTRPGSESIDIDTEIQRVLPVIEGISQYGRVSIDTQKPEVAVQAVRSGASIINDVSASLAHVAAAEGAGWIAMHRQGISKNMQDSPEYLDVVSEVKKFLVDKAREAINLGVEEVWIDPGFGFGKTLEHNLALLANISEFVATGYNVAIGISRKSMLGQLTAYSDGSETVAPEYDRLEGSLISSSYAMLNGVSLVRVHDVEHTLQARSVINGSI